MNFLYFIVIGSCCIFHQKLRDEYECSDVSDGCEESESKLNSDKEFNPGSDESEYDSEGEHFPSSERQLR